MEKVQQVTPITVPPTKIEVTIHTNTSYKLSHTHIYYIIKVLEMEKMLKTTMNLVVQQACSSTLLYILTSKFCSHQCYKQILGRPYNTYSVYF